MTTKYEELVEDNDSQMNITQVDVSVVVIDHVGKHESLHPTIYVSARGAGVKSAGHFWNYDVTPLPSSIVVKPPVPVYVSLLRTIMGSFNRYIIQNNYMLKLEINFRLLYNCQIY